MDTSGASVSAALTENKHTLAEFTYSQGELRSGEKRRTHSETLMPLIDNIFKISGRLPNDLDRIACTCGPGSFTGLRIGASTAMGFAYATGKPLIGVPTLDALAYGAACADADYIIPMLDARRGQVYAAAYSSNNDGGLERITDYTAAHINDFLASVNGIIGTNKSLHFVGEGAAEYRGQISSSGFRATFAAQQEDSNIRAAWVGRCALGMKEKPFELLYIRKPQAEREREERENKNNL